MKEKLTEYDITVITDCLHGSLRLEDNNRLWKFSEQQRKQTLIKIYEIMSSTPSQVQE
jgi:hypothetical protein